MTLATLQDATSVPAYDFEARLAAHGQSFRRAFARTVQVNVGKFCNQACHHCHVEAGPLRTEKMERATAERIVALLDRSPGVEIVDITGGAPELNASFRYLVDESHRRGRHVIDRCNLTVMFQAGQEGLGEFLAERRVEVIASLPCYTKENVEKQRGNNVFEPSIDALQRLNALGYGHPGTGLALNLVYNPLGAYLPGDQVTLEADYKRELGAHFGIVFNKLYTITNMPIKRFEQMLIRMGKLEAYMDLIVGAFNPTAAAEVMCRSLVSVGWDGRLYDCDFNQMLELEVEGSGRTLWEIESFDAFAGTPIVAGPHCFGCTAGCGSSCGGALTG